MSFAFKLARPTHDKLRTGATCMSSSFDPGSLIPVNGLNMRSNGSQGSLVPGFQEAITFVLLFLSLKFHDLGRWRRDTMQAMAISGQSRNCCTPYGLVMVATAVSTVWHCGIADWGDTVKNQARKCNVPGGVRSSWWNAVA